jgi:UDP-N-acetylmuramyl pentapeptide phosphotransferase/UDP-N-acetylglucosamine-1-phosphate transferase
MTMIGFGAYALAAYLFGAQTLAALCASLAAAAGAFLVLNWHPARLFLGDVGSVPLGFLAAALGLQGWSIGAWPLWFPLLVFAPFMCDATLTLIKRLLRRERVWQAHREHYYQRLVRMGFGHRGTAYIEYGAMAGCAALALLVYREPAAVQGMAIAFAAAALTGIALWVDLRWAKFLRASGAAAR